MGGEALCNAAEAEMVAQTLAVRSGNDGVHVLGGGDFEDRSPHRLPGGAQRSARPESGLRGELHALGEHLFGLGHDCLVDAWDVEHGPEPRPQRPVDERLGHVEHECLAIRQEAGRRGYRQLRIV